MALPIAGVVAAVGGVSAVANAIGSVKNFVSGLFGGGRCSGFNPTNSMIEGFLTICSKYRASGNQQAFFDAVKKSGLSSYTSGSKWHKCLKPYLEKIWDNYYDIVGTTNANNAIVTPTSSAGVTSSSSGESSFDVSTLLLLGIGLFLILKNK